MLSTAGQFEAMARYYLSARAITKPSLNRLTAVNVMFTGNIQRYVISISWFYQWFDIYSLTEHLTISQIVF